MKEKFLPIGTICSLKGINKKLMITGYFGVSYKGMVKMYDYVGYEYPEGTLLQNRSYLFNHDNIEKIEFLGYISKEHEILNNNLLKNNVTDEKVENNGIFTNFKFDENGVVIFDGSVNSEQVKEVEKEDKPTSNPFNEIYKKPVEKTEKEEKTIFNKFKFDANGVVIAEEQPSNVSGFKFDENGVVIADDTIKQEKKIEKEENNNAGFQFDENGVVISDATANQENLENSESTNSNSKFQFDENGVVIGEF